VTLKVRHANVGVITGGYIQRSKCPIIEREREREYEYTRADKRRPPTYIYLLTSKLKVTTHRAQQET